MRPRHLVGAVVLVAAVGVGFYLRRPAVPAARAGAPAVTSAPAVASASVGSSTRRAPAAAPAASERLELPPLDEAATRAESERTLAALAAHGRRCWEARTPVPTPPGQPDETMQSLSLHVRVFVRAGEGRLQLLDVGEDKLVSAPLRDCLLEGLDTLRWSTPGPTGTFELQHYLRMGDFTVPAGPPPVPPESAPTAPGR